MKKKSSYKRYATNKKVWKKVSSMKFKTLDKKLHGKGKPMKIGGRKVGKRSYKRRFYKKKKGRKSKKGKKKVSKKQASWRAFLGSPEGTAFLRDIGGRQFDAAAFAKAAERVARRGTPMESTPAFVMTPEFTQFEESQDVSSGGGGIRGGEGVYIPSGKRYAVATDELQSYYGNISDPNDLSGL